MLPAPSSTGIGLDASNGEAYYAAAVGNWVLVIVAFAAVLSEIPSAGAEPSTVRLKADATETRADATETRADATETRADAEIGALAFPVASGFSRTAAAPGLPARDPRSDPAPLPTLTRIALIRALSQDEGAKGYPVRIRGTVTHFDEVLGQTLILHDGEFGQFVMPPAAGVTLTAWAGLTRGDLVEIEGRTVRGGFAPNVEPSQVRKLGRGPMPRGRTVAYSAMLTGRYDCDYVTIVGVVQRAWLSSDPRTHVMFANVAIDDGIVRAVFWDYTSAADLTRFIDARVQLQGNIGTIFGQTEQLRGVSFLGRIRDVTVIEPPPDPFTLPIRSSRHIYAWPGAANDEYGLSAPDTVNHRIRVRGVVTARIPGAPVEMGDFTTSFTFRYELHVLYMRDATGGVRIETEQIPQVHPGDLIEAAGFPSVTPGRPILTNAVFRVVGAEPEPAPQIVTAANALTPDHDAELVRMEAQLLSVLTGPTERVLVLRRGDTVFNAGLDPAQTSDAVDSIRPGSRLSIAGVYSYQGGPPPSFRLYLRSPADIRVLAAAPWWTMRHSVVMSAILLLMGCVGSLWMRASGRRKRQQYQAVLNERTRVARELHDTVEQGLAGISLQLEAVAGSFHTAPEAARVSLDVARQMLRYSLEETRRSVMDLRSQALESRDLGGALTSIARQMTVGTRADAQVRVDGVPRRLDAAVEHHLLRIGLEALTNAVKHGGATSIDIELRFDPQSTALLVTDNGQGLDTGARATAGAHFGLQGVRERVDKLGG
ncbi:MAG: sensor histidine kinase, partial [Acidobacteriota bacterium]